MCGVDPAREILFYTQPDPGSAPDKSSPRPLSHEHDLVGSLQISRSGKLWRRGNQVFARGGTPPVLPPDAIACGFLRPGRALSL